VKNCVLKPYFYIFVARLLYSDLCDTRKRICQTSARKPWNRCKLQQLCDNFDEKYVIEGSKCAYWIGLYLSFHLNCVLGPFFMVGFRIYKQVKSLLPMPMLTTYLIPCMVVIDVHHTLETRYPIHWTPYTLYPKLETVYPVPSKPCTSTRKLTKKWNNPLRFKN